MVQHYLESAAISLIRVAAPRFLTTPEGYVLPTARLLPHLLSISRPALALVIVWLLAIEANWGWAVLVLAGAGATDKLDGSLARWCGCSSAFGQGLDSTCDKIMLVILLIALGPLVWVGVFWALVLAEAALFLLLTIRAGRAWSRGELDQLKLQTNDYGRWKVGIEFIALALLLTWGTSLASLGNLLLAQAALLASGSLVGKLVK